MRKIPYLFAIPTLLLLTVFAPASDAGKSWPSETKVFRDGKSGVRIRQLTDYKGHSHHFYFTNSGWYEDGKRLLFSSDRNNRTNLFSVNLLNDAITQLTDLVPIPLPREVEFLRACLSPVRAEAYFWHDQRLLALDIHTGQSRILHEMDKKWCVSMTNTSADGKYVYFGIWLDQSEKFKVDLLRGYVGFVETWQARPRSRIMRISTENGTGEVVFEEEYWIGHVNTSPTRSDLLTFCHEGPWDKVDQRIWCLNVNSKQLWKIRPRVAEGERIGHEYWYADGETIGFHGERGEKKILGHVRYDNTRMVEADFPGATGHIHSNNENLIVGDGGGVIRIWRWNGKNYDGPRLLCQHKSTMNIQQTHPHPRFSPDGKQVLFSSDMSGYGNMYLVEVPEFASLPLIEK
jgi:oligogalacturonide lyase